MKLKLSNCEVNLPVSYTFEEKCDLMNRILAEHPEEFVYAPKMFDIKYGKRVDTNRLAIIKLDVLTTYVYGNKKFDIDKNK